MFLASGFWVVLVSDADAGSFILLWEDFHGFRYQAVPGPVSRRTYVMREWCLRVSPKISLCNRHEGECLSFADGEAKKRAGKVGVHTYESLDEQPVLKQ